MPWRNLLQIIFDLNANTVLKNHQNIIHNFSRIFSWELWFFSCKKHPDYRGNRKTTFWEKPHYLQQAIQENSISILWKKVGIKGSSIKYVRKISRKTNISDPLIRTRTCAYHGVRSVSFLENFAYVLNGWYQT